MATRKRSAATRGKTAAKAPDTGRSARKPANGAARRKPRGAASAGFKNVIRGVGFEKPAPMDRFLRDLDELISP
ncbi:MAG: hypothetical protein ACKO2K_08010, partial [Alphaproteobacteria bacterium]